MKNSLLPEIPLFSVHFYHISITHEVFLPSYSPKRHFSLNIVFDDIPPLREPNLTCLATITRDDTVAAACDC